VFRSLNATLAGIVQAAGQFRALAVLAGWNLGMVFALLSWLVPRDGAEGAALALLLGEGINCTFQLAWVARIVSRRERTIDGR
jgi:O-antigen/teichoic acid export membrane protein